ncbi:MAG: hypothetical protein IKD61_06995 [Oscillospiraceae bacterium]|nr:hypothetical protein [Oscillospiraceae bacterium]
MAATTQPLVWAFYRQLSGADGLGGVVEYSDEETQSLYLADGLKTRTAQISEGHWSDATPGAEISVSADDFAAAGWDHPEPTQLYASAILGGELLFLRYHSSMDITDLVRSGSCKLRDDSQIAQLTLRLANAGDTLFDVPYSLFEPGARIDVAVTMGDSSRYPLVSAYMDDFDNDRLSPDVSLSARSVTGRLNDQTFDDNTSFTGNGNEVVAWIFGLAGITRYHIGPSDFSQEWTFKPEQTLLKGLADVFDFFVGWKMIELPDGTMCVGYPWWLETYQTNSVYQFSGNVDVTKRRTKKSLDAAYTSVRVTGKGADGTELTPVTVAVNNFAGWNLGAHRTKHAKAADGLTQADLQALAEQLAAELQHIGVGETFDGPLRPWLLSGDIASISYGDGESTDLGLITSIQHSFGQKGFFTSFTVDSGGVATAQTRAGTDYATRTAAVNGYNRRQTLADLVIALAGKTK